MKYSPILIVSGEPNSIFIEIFFKVLQKKIKSPLILIASQKILELQMKKLKVKKKINLLEEPFLDKYKLDNKSINLIDVKYSSTNAFKKITKKSNRYIYNSFKIAFEILKKGKIKKFTGISDPYEEPEGADINLNSDGTKHPLDLVGQIYKMIQDKCIFTCYWFTNVFYF